MCLRCCDEVFFSELNLKQESIGMDAKVNLPHTSIFQIIGMDARINLSHSFIFQTIGMDAKDNLSQTFILQSLGIDQKLIQHIH